MKVGIITLVQHNDNYGGTLQAFAMQTALQQLGHEPFFANFVFEKRPLKWHRLFSKPVREIQRIRRYSRFVPFWRKHFVVDPCGRRSLKAFLESPSPAETYLCGSDQIWATAKSEDSAQRAFDFLDFGNSTLKRVAYAPSFGTSQLEPHQIERLKAPLTRFTAISVREESALDLIRACGVEARWVVDPTMLFDATFWNKVATPPVQKAPKCFFPTYRWKTACNVKTAVKKVCTQLQCELEIPCSETPFKFPTANITIGPEEWIAHIRDAKFVLTNSFHCMVFAILFHKPFAVLALDGKYAKMNVRINSLTKRLGLEDRIINSEADISPILSSLINWEDVDTRLTTWREESWHFLKGVLK